VGLLLHVEIKKRNSFLEQRIFTFNDNIFIFIDGLNKRLRSLSYLVDRKYTIFSIPHEIFKRIEIEGADVFSLYSEVEGKQIILEKIDEKQY
jgi:hypothetical protein